MWIALLVYLVLGWSFLVVANTITKTTIMESIAIVTIWPIVMILVAIVLRLTEPQ